MCMVDSATRAAATQRDGVRTLLGPDLFFTILYTSGTFQPIPGCHQAFVLVRNIPEHAPCKKAVAVRCFEAVILPSQMQNVCNFSPCKCKLASINICSRL